MATNRSERPVVVLTEFKEIFFGFAKDTEGERIKLRQARQACYYGEQSHGLVGLASVGPSEDSRVSPPADIEVRKVANVLEVTLEAQKNWQRAGWGKRSKE